MLIILRDGGLRRMKFNIKNNNFKEFLKLILMEGKDEQGTTVRLIENCLIEAKEGKLYSNVMPKSGVAIGIIRYKEVDVVSPGELSIPNVSMFLDYLNRFENDDEIVVELLEQDNKVKVMRMSPKKIALIPITTKENVDDSLRVIEAIKKIKDKEGKISFGETELNIKVVVDSHYVKEVLKDGDIENMRRKFPFSVTEDKVLITVGDKISGIIETELPVISKSGSGTATYLNGIDNIFKELKGEVEIYFAEGAPMLVKKYSDKYDVRYVVAPIVDD